jgi:hypothetical protein
VAYKNPQDQSAASKRHYIAHKEAYLERNTKYRLAIRKFVQDLKEESPCVDCGIQYPYYVMDFDHLDESLTLNDINYLASTGRIGTLKKEIVKCEVVCASCHRIRTHNRANMLP